MYLLIGKKYLFVSIIMFVLVSKSKSDEISSPCDDPNIYSTDRLINGSVRLYRGNHYWELYGLPESVGYLKGPFDIWYESMAPINRKTAVMTAIEGEQSKSTFKFSENRVWGWNSDGKLYIGGKDGQEMPHLPDGGLDAVFFNGKPDKPLMIGFKSIRVYYYLYSRGNWNIDGEKEGYIRGRFEENFPSDLTAAFSWPSENPNHGYIAYLFKKDKYCRRTEKLKSKKSCDEWRDSKELFGCLTETAVPIARNQPTVSESPPTNPIPAESSSKGTKKKQKNLTILFMFALIKVWHLFRLSFI